MAVKWIFFLFLFAPVVLFSAEPDADVLIYGDSTQVNSGVDAFENIVAGKPIRAYVMVTHDKNYTVDLSSFQMGGKPLRVEFTKSVPLSSASKLELSIYHFQISGLTTGIHELPPIKVKVGGRVYQAPPLIIRVG